MHPQLIERHPDEAPSVRAEVEDILSDLDWYWPYHRLVRVDRSNPVCKWCWWPMAGHGIKVVSPTLHWLSTYSYYEDHCSQKINGTDADASSLLGHHSANQTQAEY